MITDGDRPDGAPGRAALLVAIVQSDLLALVDLGAGPHHVDAVGLPVPAGTCAACGFEHERPQAFGNGVGDLRHQVLGGTRQHGVGVPRHPLRAEHGRLDLVGREHQRRKVKSLLQDVAHAGLAADRHALFDQRCDVAVDGPFRGLQLGGDCIRGQRLAGAPEHLNDLEQPVGASHGTSLLLSIFTGPCCRC